MKSYRNMYIGFIFILCIAALATSAAADDIKASLDTSDGTSKFSIQNASSAEVANIASDGSGYFQRNVGIGTSDTAAAKLVVNGNIAASPPLADDHVATKAYVDAASGGGSGPVWRGYAPPSNGDMGGVTGMNNKCHTAFAESHACTYDEIIRLGNDYPNTNPAWIIDGEFMIGLNYAHGRYTKDGFGYYGVQSNNSDYETLKYPLCRGWTQSTSVYRGPYFNSTGHMNMDNCSYL